MLGIQPVAHSSTLHNRDRALAGKFFCFFDLFLLCFNLVFLLFCLPGQWLLYWPLRILKILSESFFLNGRDDFVQVKCVIFRWNAVELACSVKSRYMWRCKD
jgi:hypothetical protein